VCSLGSVPRTPYPVLRRSCRPRSGQVHGRTGTPQSKESGRQYGASSTRKGLPVRGLWWVAVYGAHRRPPSAWNRLIASQGGTVSDSPDNMRLEGTKNSSCSFRRSVAAVCRLNSGAGDADGNPSRLRHEFSSPVISVSPALSNATLLKLGRRPSRWGERELGAGPSDAPASGKHQDAGLGKQS